jgi:hypothetical protein
MGHWLPTIGNVGLGSMGVAVQTGREEAPLMVTENEVRNWLSEQLHVQLPITPEVAHLPGVGDGPKFPA